MIISLHVSGGTSVCFVTLWLIQAVIVLLTHECGGLGTHKNTTNCREYENISSYGCGTTESMATFNKLKTDTRSLLARLISNTNSDDKEYNLAAVAGLIGGVATKISALNKALAEQNDLEQRRQIADAVQGFLLNLSDIVFIIDKISPFKNLNPEKKIEIASKVFDAFESNGPLIAATLQRGTTWRRKMKSAEMLLRNLDLSLFQMSTSFLFKSDGFSLDMGSLREVSGSDTLGISSVLFNGASTLLTPKDSASQMLNQSYSFGTNERFNTLVMTISMNTKTPIKRLSKNVTITMKMQDPGLSSPVCYSLNPKATELIPTGCTAQSINATHATCSCNHLTSFVILMSVTKSAEESSLALDIVSYVSCSLSVLFLLLSFVTFVSFASLRSDRNTIHSQLTVCLGLGQLLFLVGIGRTQSKMVCAVIAGALHYLFLASFCWMALEGLQIYLKTVPAFKPSHSMIPVYFSIGYGVPAIIVAAAAGTFPQGYGTETNCWLSKERGFHWSFVGPVFCVVAFNTVMLVIALTAMCRHLKSPGREFQTDDPENSKYILNSAKRELQATQKLQTSVKGAATLCCIMGITWVFGSLNTGGNAQVAFAYIFVLLNSTQGVFIYFFHCVSNNKVKKEYRRMLRKATWMPDCCRQCLFKIFAKKSLRNIGQSTDSSISRGMLPHMQMQKEQKDNETSFTSVRSRSGVTTTIVSVPDDTPDDILASAGIYLGETDRTSCGGDGNKPPDTEVGTNADSGVDETATQCPELPYKQGNGLENKSLFTVFFNRSDERRSEEDTK